VRRTLTGFVLIFGLLAAPLATDAQQPLKIPRIGLLRSGSPADPYVEAFRQGLRALGYVEGQNLIIEYRYAEGKLDRLSELAAELVRLKVDIIITSGEASIRAAKRTTRTIPIVMANSGDPVESGLVASLAQPGGNITGLSALSPELSGKALELLKETFPKLSRVAVLWNPANAAKVLDFRESQVAAKALGVQLQSLEVRSPDDFDRAFGAAMRERAEALSVRADAVVTVVHRKRIVDLTAKNRLPAIYELTEFVDAGGLMSYGPSVSDNFRRAATYVDKILKGAKPADLPVEQPTKFELVVNLKTAKALGLTMPQSILLRADQVLQ
jgi:putative ABC transport system substrate-binding protein